MLLAVMRGGIVEFKHPGQWYFAEADDNYWNDETASGAGEGRKKKQIRQRNKLNRKSGLHVYKSIGQSEKKKQ